MAENETDEATPQPANNGRGYLAAIDEFLQTSDLIVEITYPFKPEVGTIKFPVGLLMNDDAIAARQNFYTLPDEDKAKVRHKYHVDLLCLILTGTPEGLPHFADLAAENPSASPADVLKSYLMRGGPLAEKLAAEAIDKYNRLTTPLEFFR